jgi:hypothetical protein
MRKSNWFFLYTLSLTLVLGLVYFQDCFNRQTRIEALQTSRDLVRLHGLTDLCLFTEARYTRNPTQADFHAPFQDSPLALEHFPSGSLMPLPPTLKKPHARLD